MSFWTSVRKPVIGGLAGGLVGGPIGMGVGAGAGYLMSKAEQDRADLDAKMGGLSPPEMIDPNDLKYTTADLQSKLDQNQGVKGLQDRANQVGGSPWLSLQEQKIGANTANTVNSARGLAASQTAQAQSQLASKSGLSAGAMERLAKSGQMAQMQGSQNAQYQGGQSMLNAGIEDERNRNQAVMALPGAELGQNSLLYSSMKNDAGIWNGVKTGNQDMQGKMYGAQLMSNAALEQAKPKGLLGLGFLGL